MWHHFNSNRLEFRMTYIFTKPSVYHMRYIITAHCLGCLVLISWTMTRFLRSSSPRRWQAALQDLQPRPRALTTETDMRKDVISAKDFSLRRTKGMVS